MDEIIYTISPLEGGPLMWMMALHVNQASAYDMIISCANPGGGGTRGPDPPPPLEKSQIYPVS